MTVSMRLSSRIYNRWCEYKLSMRLATNDDTAEYLLNVADAFDEQDLSRYTRTFIVYSY